MNPITQRVEIAEACGIKFGLYGGVNQYYIEGIDSSKAQLGSSIKNLPDYLNDLNACHEMEKVLVNEQNATYDEVLESIALGGSRSCDFTAYPSDFVWHATASQRCEAFLRTIGKWEG